MNITFYNFHRWHAFAVDGQPSGWFMREEDGLIRLHISRHAPQWLRDARSQGPYASIETARRYIERCFSHHQAVMI